MLTTEYQKNSRHSVAVISYRAFVCAFLLLSCSGEEEVDKREPCDFVISTAEIPLSTSRCKDCSFRFSFKGRTYDFDEDRITSDFRTDENGNSTFSYYNDFFEFKFKSVDRHNNLFASLNEERSLLTPDSLQQTDFNFLQPSFLLKDRCSRQYQIAGNTTDYYPDVSRNTITDIVPWNFQAIDIGSGGMLYVTDYLVTGTFSTEILDSSESYVIAGSYTLQYQVTESD